MNILFLGSGPFGVPALERLATVHPRALFVATLPDAPVGRRAQPRPTPIKESARALGLPVREVRALKEQAGADLIAATDARLVISADIRLLLPRDFLDLPPRGCFNLHGSLLPRWRGAAPIARAILAGDFHFGVTLYRMNEKLDAGPIVSQCEYDPASKIDAPLAEAALAVRAADLLEKWLPALIEGSVRAVEQDPARASYAPKLSKDDGWVEWHAQADAIENHVLALRPWPRSSGTLHSALAPRQPPQSIVIHEASVIAGREECAPPGTIRSATGAGIDVACGAGGNETVRLQVLQRAGGRPLAAADFLRGFPVAPGDRFMKPAPKREAEAADVED